MWYLQADTLVFLLGAALVYALAAAAARRVSPQVRLTPFLLLFDLGVLCFVSPALAAFYIGYTLVTYAFLRILKGVKGPALRRGLFVLFCAACALPFCSPPCRRCSPWWVLPTTCSRPLTQCFMSTTPTRTSH